MIGAISLDGHVQQRLQDIATGLCVAMFAGRPIDPALGVRYSSELEAIAQDQHGMLFAFSPGDSNG